MRKAEYGTFDQTGAPGDEGAGMVNGAVRHSVAGSQPPALQRVWSYLAEFPQLDQVVEMHRGIQYNLSMEEHEDDLISTEPRAGFVPGIF